MIDAGIPVPLLAEAHKIKVMINAQTMAPHAMGVTMTAVTIYPYQIPAATKE